MTARAPLPGQFSQHEVVVQNTIHATTGEDSYPLYRRREVEVEQMTTKLLVLGAAKVIDAMSVQSVAQKLEREVEEANQDKHEPLSRYMDTNVAVRNFKQLYSKDGTPTSRDSSRKRSLMSQS
ncbi:hypothetical protein BGZ67_003339 [Mortierella alpina]|nr:hypothetical protein BGZ67_003339 [Mortierella alpina]